jgi:hypothetical protein
MQSLALLQRRGATFTIVIQVGLWEYDEYIIPMNNMDIMCKIYAG